ncbi:hypothetical protein [Aeromonas media]|uniref:hypothetical protein n=1 Tax=Aeromonas media TaxID=651 RepID=UPI00343CF1A8
MRQDVQRPLQKVPYTKYVFANAEFVIPHPNDGTTFDRRIKTAPCSNRREKMEMAFQVIVRWQPG